MSERGTWKVVCKRHGLESLTILNGRYTIAIKDAGNYKDIWKARLVVQGRKEYVESV